MAFEKLHLEFENLVVCGLGSLPSEKITEIKNFTSIFFQNFFKTVF